MVALLAISLLLDGPTIFFERLQYDFNLALFLKGHPRQKPIFFFKLFHARHHGGLDPVIQYRRYIQVTDCFCLNSVGGK